MTDKVLNSEETIVYLRISKKTLYKIIAKGRIKTTKAGRDYRFLKSELDKFLRGENN